MLGNISELLTQCVRVCVVVFPSTRSCFLFWPVFLRFMRCWPAWISDGCKQILGFFLYYLFFRVILVTFYHRDGNSCQERCLFGTPLVLSIKVYPSITSRGGDSTCSGMICMFLEFSNPQSMILQVQGHFWINMDHHYHQQEIMYCK